MNKEKAIKAGVTIVVYTAVFYVLLRSEDLGILKARVLLTSAKAFQTTAEVFGRVGMHLEKAYNVAIEAAKQ